MTTLLLLLLLNTTAGVVMDTDSEETAAPALSLFDSFAVPVVTTSQINQVPCLLSFSSPLHPFMQAKGECRGAVSVCVRPYMASLARHARGGMPRVSVGG